VTGRKQGKDFSESRKSSKASTERVRGKQKKQLGKKREIQRIDAGRRRDLQEESKTRTAEVNGHSHQRTKKRRGACHAGSRAIMRKAPDKKIERSKAERRPREKKEEMEIPLRTSRILRGEGEREERRLN